jgi:hypothetical protein
LLPKSYCVGCLVWFNVNLEVNMLHITYDPEYNAEAPYIYFHMLDDGYMLGGMFKDLLTAQRVRAKIEAKHGPCRFKELMDSNDV